MKLTPLKLSKNPIADIILTDESVRFTIRIHDTQLRTEFCCILNEIKLEYSMCKGEKIDGNTQEICIHNRDLERKDTFSQDMTLWAKENSLSIKYYREPTKFEGKVTSV